MYEDGGRPRNSAQIILLCVWESLGKVGRLLKLLVVHLQIPLDLEFQDGG